MSIETGPYIPNLLIPRLKFALTEWDNFSPLQQDIIRSQIKAARAMEKKQLEEISKDEKAGKIISETLGAILISPGAAQHH